MHAPPRELEPLVALQHRDERHVVVVAALVDAALPPRAEVALADRVRVRGLGARFELGAAGEEMLRDARGVGIELLGAEGRALAVAEDEVHPDGAAALDALDLSVVEEQLEDVGGLGRATELGVVNLVGPVAEVGLLVDADDEVGVADPAVVEERGLVDDLAALAHGGLGRGGALVATRVLRDRDDVAALGAQRLEEGLLVAAATLEQQLGIGLPVVLARDLAPLGEQVEVRTVLAAEEVVEPAWRETALTPADHPRRS